MNISDPFAHQHVSGEGAPNPNLVQLLYTYVLRRSIDNDGLMSRLVRMNGDLAEYRAIVAEVMHSGEAAMIHEPFGYRTLHPLDYLSAWLDDGFGMVEVRK